MTGSKRAFLARILGKLDKKLEEKSKAKECCCCSEEKEGRGCR